MRALSTTSKLLAYVAAALGVAVSVSLPWFGRSPEAEATAAGERAQYVTIDGPVEQFFGGIWRALSAADGTSAADRFAGADTALLVLAGLGVLAAGLAAIRGGEHVGRSLMQTVALAIGVLTVVKLFQVPGASALLETRRGAVIALGCSGIMLMTASHIAQQKLRRQPPAQMSVLHDPNLRNAQSSVAPPG